MCSLPIHKWNVLALTLRRVIPASMEIAVRIHEERLADQAKYDQWLCDEYEKQKASEDDFCFTYDPTVDAPIDFPID